MWRVFLFTVLIQSWGGPCLARDHGAGKARGARGRSRIPKLLHHVHYDGLEAFRQSTEGSSNPQETKKWAWYQGCKETHQQWQTLFWDQAKGRQLIQEEYAWFLPTWENFAVDAMRVDALKVFILHHHGGLVLGPEVECTRPTDSSFSHFDLVMQGAGYEGFHTDMMASVPGHPFWMEYANEMQKRGKRDAEIVDPYIMTGMAVYTETIRRLVPALVSGSGFTGGQFEWSNTGIKIWGIGQWFIPCFGRDMECIRMLENRRTQAIWDMSNLYGRHHFLWARQDAEKTKEDVYVQ